MAGNHKTICFMVELFFWLLLHYCIDLQLMFVCNF